MREAGDLILARTIWRLPRAYVKEAEAMLDELMRVTYETVDACHAQKIYDWTSIKSKVKNNISGYLYKNTHRSPMILPVITEV
jgi:ribonuclease J